MSEELKLCHCGHKVEMKNVVVYPNGERSPASIRCKNCNYFIADYEDDVLIQRWNDRPLEDALLARAERAEARLDDNYSKFENIKNAITEGSIQAANIIYRGMINSNAILPSEKIRIGMAKIIEDEINLKIQNERPYTIQPSETTNWSAEEILKREG